MKFNKDSLQSNKPTFVWAYGENVDLPFKIKEAYHSCDLKISVYNANKELIYSNSGLVDKSGYFHFILKDTITDEKTVTITEDITSYTVTDLFEEQAYTIDDDLYDYKLTHETGVTYDIIITHKGNILYQKLSDTSIVTNVSVGDIIDYYYLENNKFKLATECINQLDENGLYTLLHTPYLNAFKEIEVYYGDIDENNMIYGITKGDKITYQQVIRDGILEKFIPGYYNCKIEALFKNGIDSFAIPIILPEECIFLVI